MQTQFGHWAERYITVEDWQENTDYAVLVNSGQNPKGGRPEKDYAVSIHVAEHIAMMTRTTKGREVREWFRSKRKELYELKAELPMDFCILHMIFHIKWKFGLY